MKNIILSVVSILVLIIAAALIVPSFIDWSQYKDQIKAQVEKSTGYQLDMNGSFKAAFLPTPHVNIENIAIDSAGAKGPYAFKGQVEKASVSLALMPLFGGNIAVSNVELINPVIDVKEQKFEAPAEEISQETSGEAASSTKSPAVVIENVDLQGAKISFKPLKGDAMAVEIPKLVLEADSLTGPFEFDGAIIYNAMRFAFDGSSGAYQKSEPFPMTINVKSDGYEVSYSGIVDMSRDDIAVQGETRVALSDPAALNIPIKDNVVLSGLLTATPKTAKIDSGAFTVGDTKGRLTMNASGLDSQDKNIDVAVTLSSALNLDNLLTDLQSKKASPSNALPSSTEKSSKVNYSFLPDTVEIPAGLNGTFQFSAPTVIYKNQDIKNVELNKTIKGSDVKIKATVDELPDGGQLTMNATLKGESVSRNGSGGAYVLANPSLSFDGDMNLKSLKSLASDWLGVVDAKTFDNDAVPQNASGTLKGVITGNRAELSSPQLVASNYKIGGAKVSYINGAKPQFKVSVGDFNGANIALAGTVGDTKSFNVKIKHANAKKAIQIVQKDFASDSPALQKPLAFEADVAMNDADIAVTNMIAALGTIKSKGEVNVDTGGAKPSIKANLNFETLDTQSLLTGETSNAAKGSGGSASGSTSTPSTSTAAPWTRDAIDTSFLRSMNLDLKARAKTLVHGTWVVNNPVIDVDLKNGTLSINDISGQLFGGKMTMTGDASATAEGQPLDVNARISAQSVDLNKLVKAAMSQTKDRVVGTGSFDMALKASGVSSSALINSLNGDGTLKTSALTVKGLSLAKISEAISDESLTDLADVVRGAFNDGQTPFNAIDEKLTIREGIMAVDDFRLENDTAYIASNGDVNFALWTMDIKSDVVITQPEKLPEMTMTIQGPLNAPKQSVANDLVMSFIKQKYGAKLQKKLDKVLGDKLKDTPVGGLINNLLGVPQNTTTEPASNDNTAPAQETEEQPNLQKELIKGLFNKF